MEYVLSQCQSKQIGKSHEKNLKKLEKVTKTVTKKLEKVTKTVTKKLEKVTGFIFISLKIIYLQRNLKIYRFYA